MKLLAVSAILLAIAAPLSAQCAAQANFDGCVGTAESRIAMCGGTDFKCLCDRTKEKVLCYDQCPESPTLQGQKLSVVGLVTTYCAQAQTQPSTTTPTTGTNNSTNSNTGNNSNNNNNKTTSSASVVGGSVGIIAAGMVLSLL